jgi:tetratricopeptide (TPR) repeat protein
VYARAHDLASEFGTIEQKIPVLFGNFLVALLKPKLQDALNIAEHILHLSKEANILEYLMVAHRAMGGALMWLGELSRCRSHWETIVKLCAGQRPSAIVTKYPSDFLSHANAHLSRCLLYLGFADQARYALESALSSAEGSDHASTIATVLYQAIHYCAERRDKNLARQLIPQFLAVADEHGYESWKGAGRAIELWSRQVNTDEDCDNFKEAMRLHERQGQLARPLYIRLLAEILICIGRPSEALSVIDEGIDTIERNSERRWTPELLCLRGAAISAATAKSTLEEVECYERAIMLARQMEARLLELRAATSLARLWADQDEPDKALDLLAPIYQWFTEGFDTPDLKDAKALLDRVGITRSHAVSGVLN